MEKLFYKETDGIYRLRVPFDDIYTSVFLITAREKRILFDCAATSDDVDGYIVPALKAMGYELSDIGSLVISHKHGDHAGGLKRILSLAQNIEVVTEVKDICGSISTYSLAGHTADCIGVFDGRTNTLISADGLQGAGVGKYRCSVKDRAAYCETLAKIKNNKRIENILFSHAYEPWYKDIMLGRANVEKCLFDCFECLEENIKEK